MSRSTCLALALSALSTTLLPAQSNSRGAGYDGALYTIGDPIPHGRRGPAYPNGEVGVSFMNGLCNPGTLDIEWRAPMNEDHPKFGFLVARLQNGRLVQVSDWSYCKHAFLSLNDNGSYPQICGSSPCANTAATQLMYPGCYDVYSAYNNGSRNYLGPPEEINPWLGTWDHVGSYFDRGDPDVGPPNNTDGVRSTINTGGDPVKNRVTIREQDLLGAQNGDLFFQIHVLHEGEPASNRDNNLMWRSFHLAWNGSSWSRYITGSPLHGSIVEAWPHVTTTMAGNGNDDGRFLVGVVVTGPTNGMWRYEYVVHNIDNDRGGASFSLDVCSGATIQNIGFRDIDTNALNEWTASHSGTTLTWNATGANALNWNTLYNFWFDCDVAPTSGTATIDQARVGPGALSVVVPTTVPGLQPVADLGPGCGSPAMTLSGNGVPNAGNAAFAIDITGAPSTGLFLLYSFGATTTTVAPGCDRYLGNPLLTHSFLLTDGAGQASVPFAIPSWFTVPMDVHWQAAPLIPGGPIQAALGLSNGLTTRVNATGCN